METSKVPLNKEPTIQIFLIHSKKVEYGLIRHALALLADAGVRLYSVENMLNMILNIEENNEHLYDEPVQDKLMKCADAICEIRDILYQDQDVFYGSVKKTPTKGNGDQ